MLFYLIGEMFEEFAVNKSRGAITEIIINVTLLMSGTKYRGDLEARVKRFPGRRWLFIMMMVRSRVGLVLQHVHNESDKGVFLCGRGFGHQ